ncbi:chemotaxis protein CheB [Novilysobacter arseniciresistens]|uniref:chemotaxis protein CheB n=1 Tax=Novilysobacter arseniciresistens TaxID=1385522 RepID=UPI00068CE0DC|nr:chemotaxis protein CheB [Lysobacter arseniciresistens]
MPADALRVALLARPGVARDRLRGVMDEAGVERVLEADPTELDLLALLAAAPRAVLVALDPVTEDVLDRFDEVLFDPSIDVIYEEADLAASREGWDIARWQRHLVAKLQRHGDVLPPGREPDDEPGSEAGQAPVAADEVTAPAALAPDAAELPPAAMSGLTIESPAEVLPTLAIEPADALSLDEPAFEPLAASLDATFEVPSAAAGDPVDLPQASEPPTTTMDVEFAPMAGEANPFDPVLAEAGDGDSLELDDAFLTEFELAIDADTTDAGEPGFGAPVAEIDLTLSEDGFDAPTPQPVAEPQPDAELAPVATTPPSPTGFGNLSLDDGDSEAAAQPAADDHRFRRDLDDLQERISHLSLVDDTPVRGPEQPRGAVVVLAGIGGPDAVRQLLGALPVGFPRPVLIQQRLDGARHDRLVAQMQRATSIPVKLAEAGSDAEGGTIYILPADVGIAAGDSGLRFDGSGDVLSRLPSADSAILLLSGSDAGQVDAVMNHSWAGALVAGQAADGCYDAAAPNALATRGGDTAPPAKIAALLAERWA